MFNKEEYLKELYYDISKPTAYGSSQSIFQYAKKEGKNVSRADVSRFLKKQETNSLHKEKRSIKKYRSIFVPYPNFQWQIDNAYMNALFPKNKDKYKFFLLSVDCFSRKIYTRPLKSLKGIEVAAAMRSILDKNPNPKLIQSDFGSEMKSHHMQSLFKEKNIKHFYAYNEKKCSLAEAYIKILKQKIVKYCSKNETHNWVPTLAPFTDSLNQSMNRTIGMAPNNVTYNDRFTIWKSLEEQRLKGAKVTTSFAFKLNDKCRILIYPTKFDRFYTISWSTEIYIITDRFLTEGIEQYTLKSWDNDPVKGNFYVNELSKIIVDENTEYKIDKILKKRTRRGVKEVLVTWKNWDPKRYKNWIKESELKQINND